MHREGRHGIPPESHLEQLPLMQPGFPQVWEGDKTLVLEG